MNWTVVQRILGLLLMIFSLTMLPPVLIALVFSEQSWLPFVEGFGITLAAGLLCWLPVHRVRKELRLRDGFLIVAAFWTVLGTAGAAPLYLADSLSLSWTDAVFESMSGLTTTGASTTRETKSSARWAGRWKDQIPTGTSRANGQVKYTVA